MEHVTALLAVDNSSLAVERSFADLSVYLKALSAKCVEDFGVTLDVLNAELKAELIANSRAYDERKLAEESSCDEDDSVTVWFEDICLSPMEQ